MSMPPCGTFDYVGVVPKGVGDGGFECRLNVREAIASTGDDRRDSRLTGIAPMMRIVDAGLTPDAGPLRPRVLRSRISLTADGRGRATVAEASMHVDRAVISRCRPGDLIHIARTACAGLGLSIIREGELIVAVGAVTAVPLGREVSAVIPMDLVDAVAALCRQRDPECEFPARPLQITVGRSLALLYDGRRTLGPYMIDVQHGFLVGLPGEEACATICRMPGYPIEAAMASALLLDLPDALKISPW